MAGRGGVRGAIGRLLGQRRADKSAEPERQTWAARAFDAYETMVTEYGITGSPLLREQAPALPTDRRYAYLWPFGQALAATTAVASLAGADRAVLDHAERLGAAFFAHYWDRAEQPPGGCAYPLPTGDDKFYDDNIWIGIDLLDLWARTGDARWREGAAQIFAFVVSAWDDDPTHPSPGGVFWAQPAANATRDRNTVSNAPAAILALGLHAATGDEQYLAWARRMFGWVERTLRDPSDGLYWDHLKLDGRIERTKWSYNQGTMLGAAALLGRATDDEALIARARAIADAALARYADDDRLWRQDPPFNAIFFRNLGLLGDILDDHRFYLPHLSDYAERAWAAGRDRRSGRLHFARGGRTELLVHAAGVQLLAQLAGLADRRL